MSISSKKKKVLTTVGAVALAALIALGGTFAWQSISQIALNEKSALTSAGGRLHDDFNGEDKNVYVENFGDENASPIFARIKLTEYMEVGDGAGLFTADSEGNRSANADNHATPVVDGTSILDKSTWITHIPNAINVADCESIFHDDPYGVKWTLGGQTIYMPTFLDDPESLDPDVRGTWISPDNEDNYKDYKVFAVGDTEEGQLHDGTTETHTAQETLTTSAVITMAQWISLGKPLGPYWVYDTDGWAYWAQPIEPGTATGLLLDKIEVGMSADDYYYAIDVINQNCSPGDLFTAETDGGITDNALVLMELLNNKCGFYTRQAATPDEVAPAETTAPAEETTAPVEETTAPAETTAAEPETSATESSENP